MTGWQHRREILGELGDALAELRVAIASAFLDVTGIALLTRGIVAHGERLRSTWGANRKF